MFKQIVLSILLSVACYSAAATDLIRMIVPTPPGGATDILAKAWSEQLNQVLHKDKIKIVLEHRPGAGGAVAARHVADSDPDQLVLLLTSNSIVINSVVTKPGWVLHRDLTAIGYAGTTPMLVITGINNNNVFGYKDILDKSKKLTMAHSGAGSGNWLAAVSLREKTKAAYNLIGYKGNAPALIDVMGNHVDMSVDFYTTSFDLIKSSKIRPVLTLTDQRLDNLPDVPAYGELGLGPFPTPIWWGIFSNNGKKHRHLEKIYQAINVSYDNPEFLLTLSDRGFQLRKKDFRSYVDKQIKILQGMGLQHE
jgi:tripartite-type tricarboxylate transporter receptor subunit TctC